MNHTPSPQQQDVLDWVQKDTGSLNLLARAGCGKTSTLLLAARVAKGEVAVLSYNKSIAEEIKVKVAKANLSNVRASTVHSVGFSAWRRIAPKVVVDDKKVDKIIASLSVEKGDFYDRNGSTIAKLVSLAKQCAFGFLVPATEEVAWFQLADHHDIGEDVADVDSLEDVVEASIRIFQVSLTRDREVIDFDDMILAPLVHNAVVRTVDWVFMDEAQDTNAARRALALKMLKPQTGRLIAVGDDRQAIYGFTGADSDAMDLIKKELHSKELYLTVTYRCPKAVVAEANKIVPDLQAHESAPVGTFSGLRTKDGNGRPWFVANPPAITSAILCRNTKPLVEQAYTMIRHGMGCRVEGREIGEGLVKLITRCSRGVSRIETLVTKLEAYRDREVQKWLAKGKETRAQAVADQVDTVLVLVERLCQDDSKTEIRGLVSFIRSLFGDTKPGETPRVVTLSTIHKSKGREWPTVYILDRANLLPSKWARKDWQKNQEANLEYVAITRAQRELIDLEV